MPAIPTSVRSTVATIAKPLIPGLLNTTRAWSPVVLNHEWPTLVRLMLMVFCAIFGAVMNGFFIASFFTSRDLNRIGNVFLACAGLADFLVTACVLPLSVVLLLSGYWEVPCICHVIQILVAISTYCYSTFFSFSGLVSWFRVSHKRKLFEKFLPCIVSMIIMLVFILGTTLGILGTYYELDYDYCERKRGGNLYFRLATTSYQGFTFTVTMTALTASYFKLSNDNRIQGRYRRSTQYHREMSMIKLNLLMYVMYVSFWVPYLIVVNYFPRASDAIYYQTAYLGIVRSLLSSVLYGSLSTIFGRAYSGIFYYCCCKTSIQNYPNRQRRTENGHYARNIADVRTHIMQQAVNQNNPQRGASSNKDSLEL